MTATQELEFEADAFAGLHLLTKQAEALEHELLTARAVQRFMLPPERQRIGRFDIAHMYQPLHHIGGDFIDVLGRPDGSAMVMIGDIAGHGVAAAMTFAMLKLAFVRHAATASPVELLSRVQADLADRLPGGSFVTAMTVLFQNNTATFASAGHPKPVLIRAGKAQLLPVEGSFPLLVAPEIDYADQIDVPIQAGDSIMLVTDGVLEAAGADGQRNSVRPLAAAIEKHLNLAGPAFLHAVYESLFFGELVFHDDVTLVAVNVNA